MDGLLRLRAVPISVDLQTGLGIRREPCLTHVRFEHMLLQGLELFRVIPSDLAAPSGTTPELFGSQAIEFAGCETCRVSLTGPDMGLSQKTLRLVGFPGVFPFPLLKGGTLIQPHKHRSNLG